MIATISNASNMYGNAARKAFSAVMNRMWKIVYITYTNPAIKNMVTRPNPGPELLRACFANARDLYFDTFFEISDSSLRLRKKRFNCKEAEVLVTFSMLPASSSTGSCRYVESVLISSGTAFDCSVKSLTFEVVVAAFWFRLCHSM